MVNLKVVQIRLKSIGSIQKITKSMKMVSTAKYGKADKLLKLVRPFGLGTRMFYDKIDLENIDSEGKSKLIFAITSDRGLCGAVHTQVNKRILKELNTSSESKDMQIVCVGEKSRFSMQYSFPKNIVMSVSDVGRASPTFIDACKIVENTKGVEFTEGKIIFNKFDSIVSYTTTEIPLYSYSSIIASPKLDVYSYDLDDLYSYMEFSQASLIYYTLAENSCSEHSARMTAMDNATKNASEMIDKLKLEYNQTRQSIITQELIEIISGAAALK